MGIPSTVGAGFVDLQKVRHFAHTKLQQLRVAPAFGLHAFRAFAAVAACTLAEQVLQNLIDRAEKVDATLADHGNWLKQRAAFQVGATKLETLI